MTKNRIFVYRAGLVRRGWAFRFIARNGEIVAQSETYKNKADAVTTARLVASGFEDASIVVEE